jgi:hypothetical protein
MRTRLLSLSFLAATALLLSGFRPASLVLPGQSDPTPEINRKVVEYVEANMKKKVGRGECWDLAARALDHAGAEWDGKYTFGRLLDPETEDVLPGDVIQFEKVVTRDRSGNVAREERMNKHTAIVYRVLDTGVFDIAHQNTDMTGKKVGVTRFILDTVIRGDVMIYRPVGPS